MAGNCKILEGDCLKLLRKEITEQIDLTFFAPPDVREKEQWVFDDGRREYSYWDWLKEILSRIYRTTNDGGVVYFMHSEKNTEDVLRILRESEWTLQNLIIWKNRVSAVPSKLHYGRHYQLLAFVTKGKRPRIFNRLRVDLPPSPEHKHSRTNGVYLTDVWDDIREVASEYSLSGEHLKGSKGNLIRRTQVPVALLLRIILASSVPGDTVFDPFAGTGTTLVVAGQTYRNCIGIEIDPEYVRVIKNRLKYQRPVDNVTQYYSYYRYTQNLSSIWPVEKHSIPAQKPFI